MSWRRPIRRSGSCTGRPKQGLGAAYLAAFQRALGEPDGWERLVQMDADFSHEPRDVPRLLAALDAGADLAIGSRYVDGGGTENWGLGRRIISRGGGLYARSVLGVGIQDLTAGFKAWRADTLRGIKLARRVGQGLRLPDRDDLPRAAQRLPRGRGSDPLRRPPRRSVEDVGVDLLRGADAGVAAAVADPARRRLREPVDVARVGQRAQKRDDRVDLLVVERGRVAGAAVP